MNKRSVRYGLLGVVLFYTHFGFADNTVKTGTITKSNVVVFQDNRFDFGDEKQLETFIKLLRNGSPKTFKKLQTVLGERFDHVDASNLRQEAKLDTLIRLVEKGQTTVELEKQLDRFESENLKLQALITKLEQKQNQNPQFKAVLEKARSILSKRQFQQYHQVLEDFTNLRKKQLKRDQEEIAETAYLRAEEYSSRLDYQNAVIQMAEAVEYAPQNSAYWNRYGLRLDDIARYDDAIAAYSYRFEGAWPAASSCRNTLQQPGGSLAQEGSV